MEEERFTKDDFHRMLNIAELSKKEFSALTGVSYSGVRNWTVGDKSPPYWVKSWLENYIAAKAAKVNPELAPVSDWYETYKSLIGEGKADDMQIFYRRGNDKVVGLTRLISWSVSACIMKKGSIVQSFGPLDFTMFVDENIRARLKSEIEKVKPLVEKTLNKFPAEEIPFYDEDLDTPDAK